MKSLGVSTGALPPLPSATRMSPLGSTSVWRGIFRSVAMAVIVQPCGTVGRRSPQRRVGDAHVGQQPALRRREGRGSRRTGAARVGRGDERQRGRPAQRRGDGHGHARGRHAVLRRRARKADHAGHRREQQHHADSTSPVGIAAHASFAWTSALMKPSTKLASSSSR